MSIFENYIEFFNSSSYPTNILVDLIKLAKKNIEHSSVLLLIKNCSVLNKPFRACAYNYVPTEALFYTNQVPSSHRYYVEVEIGPKHLFPMVQKYPGLNDAPVYSVNSWKEAIVGVVAHELTHCYQYLHNKPRCEFECEDSAIKSIKNYRQNNSINSLISVGCSFVCENTFVAYSYNPKTNSSKQKSIPPQSLVVVEKLYKEKNLAKIKYKENSYYTNINNISSSTSVIQNAA